VFGASPNTSTDWTKEADEVPLPLGKPPCAAHRIAAALQITTHKRINRRKPSPFGVRCFVLLLLGIPLFLFVFICG
jgi:hypothetical protein